MITIEIGKRIKELRNAKKFSQENLAFKAGIDRTYLAGVESGKRNITVMNLEKVILALDTNFKDFFSNFED